MSQILEALKSRFEYVGPAGDDRHLIRVPLAEIQTHPDFKALRGEDPKEVNLLQESMKTTGGEPFYAPCVYAEMRDNGVAIYSVDGHQRVRAARQIGRDSMIVQYVARWTDFKTAFMEALSLNFARYEVKDDSLISILRTRKATVKEISDLTGLGETTVRDFEKISKLDAAVEVLKEKAAGRVVLGRLVEACKEDTFKLQLLSNALDAKLKEARANAQAIKNRMTADRRLSKDKKFKERAYAKFYLKGEPWDNWIVALEEEQPKFVPADDGAMMLKVDGNADKTKAAWVGSDKDWETTVAVFNCFEKPHDELSLQDLKDIRSQWGQIGARFDAIINRRAEKEAIAATPLPKFDPTMNDDLPTDANDEIE